ncbi:NADH:flavin oxidoreductase/NADH oxidase family protein [Alteribacter natronophilus]|nr:NADH:flavin oxidoreductase/NADH oxidase family protein [Alteribacter natronophilus]
MKAAMSEALGTRDHAPSEKLVTLYRRWAEGGAGLLVTGNVMISGTAIGEPGNVVVENERHLPRLKEWAAAATGNATQCWMQINHPGKQVFKGVSNEAVAPSEVLFPKELQRFFPKARALADEEILDIAAKFGETARIAEKAGFTGVQVHAAHGYLISQFLSPRHNIRTDRWGGSQKNRTRFLLEVFRRVRNSVSTGFPVSVKINSADFMKGGFSVDESLETIKLLAGEGADMIEISGGTYESPEMTGITRDHHDREAYFLSFAERAREAVDVPLAVTGGFRTRDGMEEALLKDQTDLIGMARPLAVYPDLPVKLIHGQTDAVRIERKKTGWRFIDDRAMLELVWYSLQLERMGNGKETLPSLPAGKALLKAAVKYGKGIYAKRRV